MRLTLVFCCVLAILLTAVPLQAALAPEEVALLAMADSREGQRLAEYYAQVRGVPKENVCLLPGKPVHTVDRAVFESDILPAVRAWLAEDGRSERIRCLVACWDVPLRVSKLNTASGETAKRIEYLKRSRSQLISQTGRVFEKLDQIAADENSTERTPPAADVELQTLAAELDAAIKAAHARSQELPSDEERRAASKQLEQALVSSSGIAGMLRVAGKAFQSQQINTQQAAQVGVLQGRVAGLTEGAQALGRLPESVARDMQAIGLVTKLGGLLGSIRWIDEQQQLLAKNETYASFDSELSLLYWPAYSLFRWQPNALHYRLDRPEAHFPRTLMVARLAAPSLVRVKEMVDAAIATEKQGLKGKFYIDARGIAYDKAAPKPGSYGQYDQSLRDLAERLKNHTDLEVIDNNEAALFQPGDCPDTALYCGWYSLAKYVDAFDWAPGAVGYHIASSEATTLRKPGASVWCNAMLEDGITATLGPVHEPYLAAFPLPDDFFPLLLCGKYTLAEVYYRTKPFNSWAMTLVGDPLYTPFKNNPPLAEEYLPERMHAGAPEPIADAAP